MTRAAALVTLAAIAIAIAPPRPAQAADRQ